MQSSGSEELGPIPTDVDEGLVAVALVVDMARMNPFTTKSSFARMAANEIGIAASEGFISTKIDEGRFANIWMVTSLGLDFLKDVTDELGPYRQ